jgi:hypothetical protein
MISLFLAFGNDDGHGYTGIVMKWNKEGNGAMVQR